MKFTFPPELDPTYMDLADVQGSGMFVDQTGAVQIFDRFDLFSNLEYPNDD